MDCSNLFLIFVANYKKTSFSIPEKPMGIPGENKLNIAYVIEHLVLKGGTERIFTDKMNYMVTQFGYTVSVITVTQRKGQPNAFSLNEAVRQYDLSVPLYRQYHYRYPLRLFVKWALNAKIRRELKRAIKTIAPDILIGTGHFAADVVCKIPCQAKRIVESHFVRSFTLSESGLHHDKVTALWHKMFRWRYLRTIERHADVVVSLTEGDKQEWSKAKRVEVIPNFTMMPIEAFSNAQIKRVIAVGRLEVDKGYDRLVQIWGRVSERFPDWQLDVIGEGGLREELSELIKQAGLESSMTLCGTTDNIDREYAWSSVLVMTSISESFALVLLEALSHGVSCVAFDCPYGPASIIEDGRNGFLVEDGNIREFANKLSLLLRDEELRKKFSVAALERAMHFDVDVIMERWRRLFLNLLEKE